MAKDMTPAEWMRSRYPLADRAGNDAPVVHTCTDCGRPATTHRCDTCREA